MNTVIRPAKQCFMSYNAYFSCGGTWVRLLARMNSRKDVVTAHLTSENFSSIVIIAPVKYIIRGQVK